MEKNYDRGEYDEEEYMERKYSLFTNNIQYLINTI